MDLFNIAIGVLVGIGICGAIPRIAVGLYSAFKGRKYQIIDITEKE